jgi:hypothetical protein
MHSLKGSHGCPPGRYRITIHNFSLVTVNSAIVAIRGRAVHYMFLVDVAGQRAHVSMRANFAAGNVRMHHAPASGLLSALNLLFTVSRALPETCNSYFWSWPHTIEPVSVPPSFISTTFIYPAFGVPYMTSHQKLPIVCSVCIEHNGRDQGSFSRDGFSLGGTTE